MRKPIMLFQHIKSAWSQRRYFRNLSLFHYTQYKSSSKKEKKRRKKDDHEKSHIYIWSFLGFFYCCRVGVGSSLEAELVQTQASSPLMLVLCDSGKCLASLSLYRFIPNPQMDLCAVIYLELYSSSQYPGVLHVCLSCHPVKVEGLTKKTHSCRLECVTP